jgi:hypothetical protein
MQKSWLFALACVGSLVPSLAHGGGAALRVDINPDNGRRDVLTSGWTDWRVGDGVGKRLELGGGVKVSFRSDDKVAGEMWKGGFDTGATMTSDGLVARGGVEMVISGLPAGRTGIATYHNAFGGKAVGPFSIAVNGDVKVRGLKPTQRVANDYDAASAFVEVDVKTGEDIVLAFRPEQATDVVVVSTSTRRRIRRWRGRPRSPPPRTMFTSPRAATPSRGRRGSRRSSKRR